MSSLACVAAEVNESTGSAFLIAFQQHSAAVGFFRPIAEHLQVKMKAVRYSVLQKGQTLVASIPLGCAYTSSINHRLVPDQVAAREWGMERFPDQSQINLFLNRMTVENMAQLEHAHQDLLRSHSLLRSAAQVIVDFDQTGLRVTGKKFELAEKGYFPRRRGARGYQLSAALASAQGCEPRRSPAVGKGAQPPEGLALAYRAVWATPNRTCRFARECLVRRLRRCVVRVRGHSTRPARQR